MLRRLFPLFWMVLIGAAPLAAETILLVVQERIDGKPLPPPLAAKEGLGSGLFDAGCIVLEFPDSDRAPDQAAVTHTARSAGADLILTVSVEYTETAISANLVGRSARAVYALTNAANGVLRMKGTQDASNKDREADVDRRALGEELGALIAKKVAEALSAAVPAS
jgi:hypothetical protein